MAFAAAAVAGQEEQTGPSLNQCTGLVVAVAVVVEAYCSWVVDNW